MKKIFIMLSLFLIVGCSSVNEKNSKSTTINKNYNKVIGLIESSVITTNDEKTLKNKSECIIEGTALTEISENNSDMGVVNQKSKIATSEENKSPLYIAKIKVNKSNKGNLKINEEINVLFGAAIEDGILYNNDSFVRPPHKGLNYMFYLVEVKEKDIIKRHAKQIGQNFDKLYALTYYNAGMISTDKKDKDNVKVLPFSNRKIAEIIAENV